MLYMCIIYNMYPIITVNSGGYQPIRHYFVGGLRSTPAFFH